MKRRGIFIATFLGTVGLTATLTVGLSSFGRKFSHDGLAGAPSLKARAEDLKETVVTPHLNQKIVQGRNILWCSTFQLAWNEFCGAAGGPIRMENEPPVVAILNQQSTTKDDIDNASYVAKAGIVKNGIVEQIKEELDKKFEGKARPDLLQLTEGLPPDALVAYSYLFKALPFKYAFVDFNKPLQFADKEVASFGIDPGAIEDYRVMSKLAGQVTILDRTSNDDFILEFQTETEGDRLILAKVSPMETLGETVQKVRGRVAEAKPREMDSSNTLQVPVLDFDVLKEYPDLSGKPILSEDPRIKGMSIVLALQSIRFKLDRNGAVLKSEAVAVAETALVEEPPIFIFDKPFLILLECKGAKNPYFALWVDNAELLVPF